MGWSCDWFSLSFCFNMDAVELELWSFIKQQILRRIYYESTCMGLQLLSLDQCNRHSCAVLLHRGSCLELFTENFSHLAHPEHSSLPTLDEWFYHIFHVFMSLHIWSCGRTLFQSPPVVPWSQSHGHPAAERRTTVHGGKQRNPASAARERRCGCPAQMSGVLDVNKRFSKCFPCRSTEYFGIYHPWWSDNLWSCPVWVFELVCALYTVLISTNRLPHVFCPPNVRFGPATCTAQTCESFLFTRWFWSEAKHSACNVRQSSSFWKNDSWPANSGIVLMFLGDEKRKGFEWQNWKIKNWPHNFCCFNPRSKIPPAPGVNFGCFDKIQYKFSIPFTLKT